MEENQIPGKGGAVASLVLGIISILLAWFFYSAIIGLICGVVGLFLAARSKKKGFSGGMRTAGFVCSLVGAILSAVIFVSCIACAACLVGTGALDEIASESQSIYEELAPYL